MTGNISGKALYFTINGSNVTGPASWEATETGDELDGTTGLDSGKQSTKIGCTGIRGNCRVLINITNGVSIRAESITNLRLFYYVGDASPAIYLPVATIFNVRKSGEVRGRFELSFEFASDGDYTVNK